MKKIKIKDWLICMKDCSINDENYLITVIRICVSSILVNWIPYSYVDPHKLVDAYGTCSRLRLLYCISIFR